MAKLKNFVLQEDDTSSSLKAGLPLAKGMSLSHWQQTTRSHPLLNERTTRVLPAEADIVVIGSGLSGALTALSLLRSDTPPASIVMLEARELCSGATGKNAGHCKPDAYRGYSEYEERFGAKEAIKILANEKRTWQAMVAFIKDNEVDCDLWTGKTMDVFMDEESTTKAAGVFQAFQEAGGDVSAIEVTSERSKARKVSRLEDARAVYAWDASTLHPWKLVAYIIQQCLKAGLNLQTWTPVLSITGSGHRWTVNSDQGSINTPTVIHATNGFACALLPEMTSLIDPTPHMCNRIYPSSSFSGTNALQNSYGVIYANGMYSVNPRSISDGVILVGGSPPSLHELEEYVAKDKQRQTDDSLVNFEPVTTSVRELGSKGFRWESSDYGAATQYDCSWSGILGMSADSVPFVGAVPGKPGQWMSCGHNGHGMARIFTCAPALAKLVQGHSWSETGLPGCFQVTEERLRGLKKL
ncbi:hypothetical protein L202_08300 [Cryptococcus amylolentus CBS 6039]|uniref:FAD dependent oxidoreductase domain-containing protein n=2 Tax=Cryptococcus amylolentus TaxID=104669 RepID=A0A1E3H986_9TREE|nr:hypothetical protein L202_08300 [Cryptococcus amylolentus CBS 6039]ODN72873.1 hypothetical protein L202_08300 [Cryptococcus amylolentus CBS 6039]ODN98062.1 hypothetical protein I350_07704 [Cryptococcus amylolentus CBS 6273]